MRRGCLIGVAVALAGCVVTVEEVADIPAEGLYVAARIRGGAAEPDSVIIGRGPAIPIKAAADDTIVVWALEPDKLIDETGRALDVEDLHVRPASAAPPPDVGTCERCLVSAANGAQLLLPGDSCPPPVGTAVQAFPPLPGQVLERLRHLVRIERKGDCACSKSPELSDRAMAFEITGFRADPEPIDTVEQLADGTIGLFAAQYIKTIAADGSVRERGRLRGDWCGGDALGSQLGDEVLDAVAQSDGRFLVLSSLVGDQPGFVRAVDADLQVHEMALTGASRDFDPVALRRIDGSDDVILLGTHGQALEAPAAYRCRPLPRHLECASLFGPRQLASMRGATDALIGDQLVVVDAAGGWLVGWPTSTNAYNIRVGGQPTRTRGPDGAIQITEFVSLGRRGDRLWACGHAAAHPVHAAVVVTATVPAQAGDLRWRFGALVTGTRCQPFVEAADGALLMPSSKTNSLKLTAAAPPVEELTRAEAFGGLKLLERFEPLATGNRALLQLDGSVLIQTLDPASTSTVHGPTSPVRGDMISALLADGDSVLAFGPGGRLFRLRPDPAAPLMITPLGLTGLEVSDVPRAAAFDTRRGDIVLVGRGTAPWIARVKDGAAVKVALPVGHLTDDSDLLAVAEAAPGRLVVAGAQGTILIVDGEVVEVLPLEWDDPLTDAVEVAPVGSGYCGVPPHLGSTWGKPDDLWRAVSGDGNGVAWLGGCWDAAARVVAVGPRPYATRVAVSRLEGEVLPDPGDSHFGGVQAICGDDAVFLMKLLFEGPGVSPEVWRHGRGVDDRLIFTKAYALNEHARTPLGLFGAPASSVVVGNWADERVASIRGLTQREGWTGRVTVHDAASTASGTLVATAGYGRLIVGHACD